MPMYSWIINRNVSPQEKSRNRELEDKIAYLESIIAQFSLLMFNKCTGFHFLHRQNMETIHGAKPKEATAVFSVSNKNSI